MPNMNQLIEAHEALLPAQGLRVRYQYACLVLILCLCSGLIDHESFLAVILAGILILYIFGPSLVEFLDLIHSFAVTNGIRQHSISAREKGPKKSLAMIPRQENAPQGEYSYSSEAPKRKAVVLDPQNAVSNDAAALDVLSEPNLASPSLSVPPPLTGKSSPSPTSSPRFQCSDAWNTPYCPAAYPYQTSFGSVDPCEVGSAPSSQTTTPSPESTTTPISLGSSDAQESGRAFELESRTIRSLTDRWNLEEEEDDKSPQIVPRLESSLELEPYVEPGVVGELEDLLSRLSIMSQGSPTVSIMRALRTVRKSKVQRVANKRIAKLRCQRPRQSRVVKNRANYPGVAKGRARRLRRSVKRQAGANSAAKAEEEMVGLETDVFEATMIGSDVDGEMDETPDSDDGSSFVNADPMQLEEDGPQNGSSASKGKKPLHGRVKVPFETIRDRTCRAVAGSLFRQSYEIEISSRKIVSSSKGASTQASQQHAAPVSVSETGHANTDAVQGVAQSLTSTNSAADLREARRGKQREARTPPAQVAGPSPAVGAMGAPVTADGNTSDTTQPTTTPASTLPSSDSSTRPATPSPANPDASAPEKQARKRSCEESAGELAKDPNDQPALGSASSEVPATRRVLPTRARKRNLGANGTQADKAADGQKVEDLGSSSTSEPETTPPPPPSPESSKRVQQRRPGGAEDDQEVVPLNEAPDRALTEGEIVAQGREALWDLFPFHDDSD